MKQSESAVFAKLKSNNKTVFLSTLSGTATPNASYAPFVMDETGSFYLFLSELAGHTQDMLTNPVASVMLIEDEQDSSQIFARCRATYQCDVYPVNREDPDYNTILDKMETRFGNMVQLLRGLTDFILFRLTPTSGQFVMGFGKAYNLTGEGLLELEYIDPSASKPQQSDAD